MLKFLTWLRRFWPRGPLRFRIPVEGCTVFIEEDGLDLYERRTTQIRIMTERAGPGEPVWRRSVLRQKAGGPLVVNVSRLKTVRGKTEASEAPGPLCGHCGKHAVPDPTLACPGCGTVQVKASDHHPMDRGFPF